MTNKELYRMVEAWVTGFESFPTPSDHEPSFMSERVKAILSWEDRLISDAVELEVTHKLQGSKAESDLRSAIYARTEA
jgi:hypothetical protein